MQRNADTRGWLCHGGWPEKFFPLRRKVDGSRQFAVGSEPYPFVSVEGDGVHEIAVGPVHAGTIEPGHFRFSVVGEKVLRLEERLGYTHKGVGKRFEGLPQSEGHRLAARVSGDSAVAFSWAYCAAVEAITQIACPARATDLRALALEHERIANHLGDLGALGNDAGFAFGLTQFSRLKEDLLRANAFAFGARYLFDYVTPGGVASDLPLDGSRLFLNSIRSSRIRSPSCVPSMPNMPACKIAFEKLGDWRRVLRRSLARSVPPRAPRAFRSICESTIRGRPTTGSIRD